MSKIKLRKLQIFAFLVLSKMENAYKEKVAFVIVSFCVYDKASIFICNAYAIWIVNIIIK
jgi:hypothetical protein